MTARRLDAWWLIESSHDWLLGDLSAFFELVPDPTRGANTMRVEVLLRAFCESVWTGGFGSAYDVTATASPPEAVYSALTVVDRGRVIAFLPPPDEEIERLGSEEDPNRESHLRLVQGNLIPKYDAIFDQLSSKQLWAEHDGGESR